MNSLWDPNRILSDLCRMTQEEISEILRILLCKNALIVNTEAVQLRETYPGDFLLGILNQASATGNRASAVHALELLRSATWSLFRDWQSALDSQRFLKELVYLISALGHNEAAQFTGRSELFDLAAAGRWRGALLDERGDMQLCALQALFNLYDDEKTLKLARRFVTDRRYSALCFRRLVDHDVDCALKYIQTLLVCAIENEEIDLPVVLEHYYQALGLDAFVASLEALLDQLARPSPRQGVRAPDLWCQYKEVMEEIGIGLDFVSSDDLEFEIPDMALGAIVLVHWDIANDGRNEKAHVRLMNQAVIEFMRMHELCSVPFGSEVAPSLAQIELQEWLEGSGDYA